MIFGSFAASDPSYTIIVLVFTLLILYIIGWLLTIIRQWIERHKYGAIFENMERSLMQLGLISFGLFLFDPQNYGDGLKDLEYGQAFDLTHLIILFLMVVFVFEAIALLQFCSAADKSFLVAIAADSEALYSQYQAMQAAGKWESYLFHKSTFWGSGMVSLRTQIEFKIIQRLFLRIHKLPSEFSFQKYSSHLFKIFITEVGDASSLSWIVFLLLCVVNFFRLKVIDPPLMRTICPHYYTNSSTHEHTAEQEYECSLYYALSFACFVMFFLCIVVYICFHVTGVYFDSLIHKSLLIDNIDYTVSGRFGYKRVLEAMMSEEEDELLNVERDFTALLEKEQQQAGQESNGSDSGVSTNTRQQQQHGESNHLSRNYRSYREIAKEMQEIKVRDEYKSHAELRREHSAAAVSDSKASSGGIRHFFSSFIEKLAPDEGDVVSLDIRDVFFRSSHWLYFRFVESCLFLQCAYVALWCCQLMPMVHIAQHHHIGSAALWVIVLTFPIPWNFYIASQTVNKAVLIRSVCSIDRDIIGVVCDEIIAESKALTEFRERMRKKLSSGKLQPESWKPFVYQLFKKYDRDNSGSLSKMEFRCLLEDVDIYLGHSSFGLLWSLIDVDKSEVITWDELFIILFPELKREIKLNLEIMRKIRTEIAAKNPNINIHHPTDESVKALRRKFDALDVDRSGQLDKDEFRELLTSLHVTCLTDRSFNVLFSCIDFIAQDNHISFEEFVELVYPQTFSTDKPMGDDKTGGSSSLKPLKSATEPSPLFSPNISIRTNVRNNSVMSKDGMSSRSVGGVESPRTFTAPKHPFKLDDKIANILSGVNSNSSPVASPSEEKQIREELSESKAEKEEKAIIVQPAVSSPTPPLPEFVSDPKVAAKPPKPTKAISKSVVGFVSQPEVFRSAVSDGEDKSVDAAPGFSEPVVIAGSSVDDELELSPSTAAVAAPQRKKRSDSSLSTVSRDSPVMGRSSFFGRLQQSPVTNGSSDRDDTVYFAIAKGATELGLGLVEHRIGPVIVHDSEDVVEDEDGQNGDDESSGDIEGMDPESIKRKKSLSKAAENIAQIRVASIRLVNKSNKPHPSGLRVNDVICGVNGRRFGNYDEMFAAINLRNSIQYQEQPCLQFELCERGEAMAAPVDNGPSSADKRAATKKKLLKAVRKMSIAL